MRYMRFTLYAFLAFHIISVFIVNLSAFSSMKDQDVMSLNYFGRKYVPFINTFVGKNNSVSIYTNLSGTNRGYEFFSPNVANKNLKLKFVDQDGHEIRLYKSFESKMKFGTASYFINSGNVSQALRHKMLVSYCKRIFAINDNVSVIHIILTLQQSKPLYNEINNAPLKTVELYTVHRL